MIDFLEKEATGGTPVIKPPRIATAQFYTGKLNVTKTLQQVKVNLGTKTIFDEQDLAGRHSYIDSEYMRAVEVACLADSRVQAEIRASELPDDATVMVEPWAYATDGMNDMKKRITMVCQQIHVYQSNY